MRGSVADALRTPPYEGMFDVVPRLVQKFEARVWIISKCGLPVQQRTRQWFAHHDFFERTGIDPECLRFCAKRPQKTEHCAELGITHFIDDRSDVLEAMLGMVPNLYLFGPQRAAVAHTGLARISHRAVRRAEVTLMISGEFDVNTLDAHGMHAEPIAALDALKLVSLVLQSTHSHSYEFPSRTARDELDSAHRSRSL